MLSCDKRHLQARACKWLGRTERFAEWWQKDSKQRPPQVRVSRGETCCIHASAPSSGLEGIPHLLRALMFRMLIGKCKPDNASLSFIYYLYLDIF